MLMNLNYENSIFLTQAATVLAKQLVTLRKQKNKNLAVNSKITAIGYQAQSMHSSAKMAGAMATTSKVSLYSMFVF